MADTIITNTPDKNDSGSAAGWVVALVIVVAVLVGGFVMYQKRLLPCGTSRRAGHDEH